MKTELSKISQDLEQSTITEQEARALLLGLLGVSNQREQLLSFYLYNIGHKNAQYNRKHAESVVDAYLKRKLPNT
jgi:hypothetical protein